MGSCLHTLKIKFPKKWSFPSPPPPSFSSPRQTVSLLSLAAKHGCQIIFFNTVFFLVLLLCYVTVIYHLCLWCAHLLGLSSRVIAPPVLSSRLLSSCAEVVRRPGRDAITPSSGFGRAEWGNFDSAISAELQWFLRTFTTRKYYSCQSFLVCAKSTDWTVVLVRSTGT